jgi:hypothetical protein
MKPVFRKLAPQLTQLYGKDVNFSSGAQDLMLQCVDLADTVAFLVEPKEKTVTPKQSWCSLKLTRGDMSMAWSTG